MTSQTRARTILATRKRIETARHIAHEINPLKSRLIGYLGDLEAAEARDAANRLGKIISQLEGWQARFG